jgi:hypothetical protein
MVVGAIEGAREEFLCCLLCGEGVYDGLLLAAAFLATRYMQDVSRFHWSAHTVVGFYQAKIAYFDPHHMSHLL